jgi:hypothetical protein
MMKLMMPRTAPKIARNKTGINIPDTPRAGCHHEAGLDEILNGTASLYGSSPDHYLIGDDHDRYMAMLNLYGDDSFGRNNAGSQGCCVVAGYVTDSTVWKRISDDWRIALNVPPKIAYFRMREYVNLCNGNVEEAGEFRNMSKADANKKFYALVAVLERHGRSLGWVESAATWDIFNDALTDEWRAVFKSPYSLCVIGILKGCRDLMNRIGGFKPVDFTFDEQDGFDLLLYESWKLLQQILPPEYREIMFRIGFANDKLLIPLQCADLLAWHVRRQYIRPVEV